MSNQPNVPESPPIQAAERKLRGKRAFHAGRFAEAIDQWNAIPELDETLKRALAEAHFRQAATLHLEVTGLPHLLRATQLLPNDPIYAYWHAVGLHKAKRLEEALVEYQRAESLGLIQSVGVAPRNPSLSIWLARKEAGQNTTWPEPETKLGDPRHATPRMVYDALVQLTRNDDDGTKKAIARLSEMSPKALSREVGALRYAYFGVAHARRGQINLAVENWRLAARAWPTHRLVQHNLTTQVLAEIHAALAQSDRVGAQKRAAETDMADAVLQTHLSGLHYDAALQVAQENRWVEASGRLALIAQALNAAKGADRRPILHNQALLYEMAENWSAAAKTWRELLRALPRGKRAEAESSGGNARKWIRRHAIECYKRAGELDEAIKVLRQSAKQTPDDVDTRLDLVRALYANEQVQAAENEAIRLLELNPNHVDTLLQLGEMQMETEQFYMAEKNIRHALSIAPKDRRVRAAMAEVLHQFAHFDERWDRMTEAIDHFEQARQFAPESMELLVCTSRAYADIDQLDKAREIIGLVLVLGKGKPEVYYNAVRVWTHRDNLAEAEAILQQAERDGALDARLLGMIGMDTLDMVYPAPPRDLVSAMMRKFGPEGLMIDSPLFTRPKQPINVEMHDYGHALLRRAMQHPSATGEMLVPAFMPLLSICSHEALPYIEWLSEHLSNDPLNFVLLGCIHASQKNFRAAEMALDRARSLAKAARNVDAEDMARDFRRSLYEPEFAAMIDRLFSIVGQGYDPEMDFDDDDFDFE